MIKKEAAALEAKAMIEEMAVVAELEAAATSKEAAAAEKEVAAYVISRSMQGPPSSTELQPAPSGNCSANHQYTVVYA